MESNMNKVKQFIAKHNAGSLFPTVLALGGVAAGAYYLRLRQKENSDQKPEPETTTAAEEKLPEPVFPDEKVKEKKATNASISDMDKLIFPKHD